MIHGKFFSGLPPKMMNRSSRPNRQQSNLFWPDESDIESANESKSKREQKVVSQTSVDSDSSNVQEIEPSKLFQQQLTSKIEFYDMEDNCKSVPKIKDSCERDKLDAFSSKSEFYDNVNEVNTNNAKTNNNSKKDFERNTKNSPKIQEKRIKFIDNALQDKKLFTPKSILRNNESTLKQKSQDQIRKKLIKKRNLSKSVENLSTQSKHLSDSEVEDCVNIIENDVKNINIHQEDGNDEGLWRNYSRNEDSFSYETFNNQRNSSKMDKTQRCGKDYHDDGWDSSEQIDENFYRKSIRNETQVIYQDSSSDHGSCLHRETQNILNKPAETNRNTLEYGWDEKRNNKNDMQIEIKKSVNEQNTLPKWNNQRVSDNSVNISPQRHLVSSITFGNDNEVSHERPSKNIRNAAVTRVTVGLLG